MRLKLTYINVRGCACIEHPHYDLWIEEDHEEPRNIGCILIANKSSKKIIEKMIKLYNYSLEGPLYRFKESSNLNKYNWIEDKKSRK